MKTGMYGAICVIIALTASIIGGYLLNAETVTDCETKYTYVTDIAGAFEGSSGDVEMDYNPAANVTGWSVSQDFNHGYMMGVNFRPTSPNSYFIYGDGSGPSTTETDTITIQSFEEGGVSRWQAVSTAKGVVVDNLRCTTMRIAEPGAIAPAEQLRLVYFFNLMDVMTGYGYTDYETLGLSMSIDYPGNWPGITFESGFHYHYKTSRHPAYYTYDGTPVSEATVYGKSAVIAIGEDSGPVSTTRVGFIGSFTISVTALTAADVTYVDPDYGIMADGSNSVYWNNNQQNISTEIVFTKYDLDNRPVYFGYATMKLYSGSTMSAIELEQASGNWTIFRLSGDPETPTHSIVSQTFLGKWDGVSLTIENGRIVAKPVSNFVSFSNYDVINSPLVFDWDILGGGDLTSMKIIREGDYMAEQTLRLQVQNTKVRVVEGGLYIQNGIFDMDQSFPDTKAFKLTLGSAAHVGDSVTVSGTDGSVTIPVTANGRFIVDGEEILFGLCSLMWVSGTMPTAMIDSVAYPAALYQRSQSYEAGHVWMSTPKGIVDMGEIGESPVIHLDGLWAPAVNWYYGDQDASSRTEFSDITKGVFKWDKSQMVIVMMGMSILLGLAGSYYGYTRMADWIVIVGCVAGAWCIL